MMEFKTSFVQLSLTPCASTQLSLFWERRTQNRHVKRLWILGSTACSKPKLHSPSHTPRPRRGEFLLHVCKICTDLLLDFVLSAVHDGFRTAFRLKMQTMPIKAKAIHPQRYVSVNWARSRPLPWRPQSQLISVLPSVNARTLQPLNRPNHGKSL
jgi:hypothetical protein